MIVNHSHKPQLLRPHKMDPPELPPSDKLKKALHIIIHIIHLLIPSLAIVAAAYYCVGERDWPPPTILLLTYTLIISIFLYIIEAYIILSKAHRYPEWVYKSLYFLTTLLGRSVFYQFLGSVYIIAFPTDRWGYWHNKTVWFSQASRVLGWIIWSIGVGMSLTDVLARAYHFTDWVWEEPGGEEGELRLDSDEEEGEGGGLLVPDQGGLSWL